MVSAATADPVDEGKPMSLSFHGCAWGHPLSNAVTWCDGVRVAAHAGSGEPVR
ncbi:hypothetical protein HUW46_08861 [Amycolatopsis sp. CA-230715]|nr:hypothetical protein HUW46_08861 [Amycolatopsis sp. CA-230715]